MLLTFFRYADWANARVLEAIEALPAEQAAREFSGTFRTFRDAIAHIAGADWLWLERWGGVSPRALPEWVGSAAVPELRERWSAIVRERLARLEASDDAELDRRFTCRTLKADREWTMRVADMLLHVANHTTHHRGQLVAMLREAGTTPPATDLLLFVAD